MSEGFGVHVNITAESNEFNVQTELCGCDAQKVL